MIIRKATEKDINDVERIYNAIHDGEEAGKFTTGWLRDVYPTRKVAEKSVEAGDLFVIEDEGKVVAATRINEEQVAEYVSADWTENTPADKVLVMHTLVVDPAENGKGYAKEFVKFYEDMAKENGYRALRMDTNEKNERARKLYASLGFTETGIVGVEFNGIPDVGLVCLEKVLQPEVRDFDAVVFDMDGVILDSETASLNVWINTAEELGLENMEYIAKAVIGMNSQATRVKMTEFYGPGFDYDEVSKVMAKRWYEMVDEEGIPLMPGVVEIFDRIKELGKKLGLATSTRKEVAKKELEDLSVFHYFDETMFGDLVERSKPDPDIYLKACELLGVKPERAIAVEDSYNGVRSAAAAGMQVIMVPDKLPPTDEMRELAHAILDNLLEVRDYISNK